MTIFYIIGFCLLSLGIVLLLGLNPERIGLDIETLLNDTQSLKQRARSAKGKNKRGKLTLLLDRIKNALKDSGKEKYFGISCAISLLLMIAGCVISIAIGNPFLAPIAAVAFAMIPFVYLLRTVDKYDNQVKLEMERGLASITASYVRTRNLQVAVAENIQRMKPPLRDIFEGFLAETSLVTSDTKRAIEHLKEKINDTVFHEWCDALISCQLDHNLIDTLPPIVARLADMRVVNGELKVMSSEHKREYWIMVLLVIANIPLLYLLNKDWYAALMYTTLGKVALAICGAVILITSILMMKFTKPVTYKK